MPKNWIFPSVRSGSLHPNFFGMVNDHMGGQTDRHTYELFLFSLPSLLVGSFLSLSTYMHVLVEVQDHDQKTKQTATTRKLYLQNDNITRQAKRTCPAHRPRQGRVKANVQEHSKVSSRERKGNGPVTF